MICCALTFAADMIAGDRLLRDEPKARDAMRNGERIELRMVAVGLGEDAGALDECWLWWWLW